MGEEGAGRVERHSPSGFGGVQERGRRGEEDCSAEEEEEGRGRIESEEVLERERWERERVGERRLQVQRAKRAEDMLPG